MVGEEVRGYLVGGVGRCRISGWGGGGVGVMSEKMAELSVEREKSVQMVEAEMVNGGNEPGVGNEGGRVNYSSTSGRDVLRAKGLREPGSRSGSSPVRLGAWGKLNALGVQAGPQKEARGDKHGLSEDVDWAAGVSWEVIAQEFDGLNAVDALALNS
ncbi:hypothetical protein R1flu_011865 [Riccia fluitans]|uniref:Uncharacterized protein n=1 Tax=Riccia fluitans TaxID=41844 RepID=A0ABD1Z8Z6_9MARC